MTQPYAEQPPWEAGIADGCSLPKALRLAIPRETPDQIACCNAHDHAYYNGGTCRDRAIADAWLLLGLLETGMDVDLAHQYHVAVRVMGKSYWREARYSDDLDPPNDRALSVESP